MKREEGKATHMLVPLDLRIKWSRIKARFIRDHVRRLGLRSSDIYRINFSEDLGTLAVSQGEIYSGNIFIESRHNRDKLK